MLAITQDTAPWSALYKQPDTEDGSNTAKDQYVTPDSRTRPGSLPRLQRESVFEPRHVSFAFRPVYPGTVSCRVCLGNVLLTSKRYASEPGGPQWTSEKPGASCSQGLLHAIWLQDWKPSPGRSETNYHPPGGAHGLESEMLLRPERGGDSQETKRPASQGAAAAQRCPGPHWPRAQRSTVSPPRRAGPGWLCSLPRWGKARPRRDLHRTEKDDLVTGKGHF